MEAKGHLDKAVRVAGTKLHVWLKIDCGYHRAGVDPASDEAERLVSMLHASNVLIFDGILSHSGHSYYGHDRDQILAAAREELKIK